MYTPTIILLTTQQEVSAAWFREKTNDLCFVLVLNIQILLVFISFVFDTKKLTALVFFSTSQILFVFISFVFDTKKIIALVLF